MIIASPSGGIMGVGGGHGGLFPQSEALPPLTPSQRKKGHNQLFLANFLIFAPQNRILPPRCPPQKKKKKKKKMVPPLATPSGGVIVSQMFSLLLFCSCFHEKDLFINKTWFSCYSDNVGA